MPPTSRDSFKCRSRLVVEDRAYDYFSLEAAARAGLGDVSRLPCTLKVLLENVLRYEDGETVTEEQITAFARWLETGHSDAEIAYRPARILTHDSTGMTALEDLAVMREAMERNNKDPQRVNPVLPVDLSIDHSVMIDVHGRPDALERNMALEIERNKERYTFLRWGQRSFDNLRIIPPGTGICHQINVEYLAQTVWTATDGEGREVAYPDTCLGTDSHTTMINGLGVLAWGVGAIEAEAAMLGEPNVIAIPDVVGVRLTGALPEGATTTDLALALTERLRAHGVVGKFVEYFGPGVDSLSLPERATIANMAPEYGATCGFFPVDAVTIAFLAYTGRDPRRVALAEAYAKAQGLWRDSAAPEPRFSELVELDLGSVEPTIAGPQKPHDRVPLSQAAARYREALPTFLARTGDTGGEKRRVAVKGRDFDLGHGDVVLAAITSCTNTSNPSVLIAAGLLARNAVAKGLAVKPWVKTSLAPGSRVAADYLSKAGLQDPLDALGFHIAAFGCTSCIGNSGPLDPAIAETIRKNDLVVAGVLSGNRNFEGRVHPQTWLNYLASPPLVVAYALAGSMSVDLYKDPLGQDPDGRTVYLRDIWPSNAEVEETMARSLSPEMFRKRYGADMFDGRPEWRALEDVEGATFRWNPTSTYVKRPPYLDEVTPEPRPLGDILGARALALLGDMTTTDHIIPAGDIPEDSAAGEYLISHQVRPGEFNSYAMRRGNHEVTARGTFANIRLRNIMARGEEGGITRHMPSGERMRIYDAAMRYADEGVPVIIIAGKQYGFGSSRDAAAKGTRLLNVRALVAEGYERIHRANLVCMGVLPLQFPDGTTWKGLEIDGSERFDILGIDDDLRPGMELGFKITRTSGESETVPVLCRVNTQAEIRYYRNGGILPYVLRHMVRGKAAA